VTVEGFRAASRMGFASVSRGYVGRSRRIVGEVVDRNPGMAEILMDLEADMT
jgi:hypothetical protein